ncbi:hypothetical protein [Lysobacter silvisoli]|uniref:hypothetical protein n=1 Tax=Lysobacter silvisoli TaxID=2293254 RepID=UPI0011C02617|nr:hypothetical protein [Lysobacter silvisoli]
MTQSLAQLKAGMAALEADLGDLKHEQAYFWDIEGRFDVLLSDASPEDAEWALNALRGMMDRHAIG